MGGQLPKQLEDYLHALRRWAGSKSVALAFLSHQEAKTVKDEVVAITFANDDESVPSLEQILTSCLGSIRATRTHTHVEDFIRYIRVQFGEDEDMNAAEASYVEAVKAEFELPQNRRAIAAMLLSQEHLHETIINEIGNQLLCALSQLHDDFEVIDDQKLYACLVGKNEPWEARRRSWPANVSIAIEAGRGQCKNVCFGVNAPDPKHPDVRADESGCISRSAIENGLDAVQGGYKSEWWPWWTETPSQDRNATFAAQVVLHSPTNRVEDFSEIAELIERMVLLATIVNTAVSSG